MIAACGLLARAQREGVSLEAAGDRLRLRAPRKPADDLLAELQAHKAKLLKLLSGEVRTWAEGFAWLCAMPRPAPVPEPAWRRFIDDSGCFLDGGWAERAASLGWRSLELFGCHPDAPFARYDRQGLLWLIDGRQLLALTAETAVIESCTGARLTYRRKPIHDEACLRGTCAPETASSS